MMPPLVTAVRQRYLLVDIALLYDPSSQLIVITPSPWHAAVYSSGRQTVRMNLSDHNWPDFNADVPCQEQKISRVDLWLTESISDTAGVAL